MDTRTFAIKASIENLPLYQKDQKRTLSDALPASVDIGVENLVKTGQLTREQANLVKSCNSSIMFGTLMDALQSSDSTDSTDYANATDDPFAELLKSYNGDGSTQKSDSTIYDTFASLMPADPRVMQQAAKSAGASGNSDLEVYDKLESLLKGDPFLNGQSAKETDSTDQGSSLYDSLISMMPKSDPYSGT